MLYASLRRYRGMPIFVHVAGSDHLQLIKFWRSCAPGKGSVAGENFVSALLQPSRTLCVSGGTAAGAHTLRLSERFFILISLQTVEMHICQGIYLGVQKDGLLSFSWIMQ